LWTSAPASSSATENFLSPNVTSVRTSADFGNFPAASARRARRSRKHEYPEKRVRLKFFRCAWQANEPQALGCPAFAWVTREELAAYEFPAADAHLLARLREDKWWQT
jgi:hypothetical protein